MTPELFTVHKKRVDTSDVATLWLKPINSKSNELNFNASLPGQFNMLYVFGKGEIPISISGIEADGSIVHTIRDVGLISKALVELNIGDSVGVRGPFGSAWPISKDPTQSFIFVAGGLGIAPLRTAIQTAIQISKQPNKNIYLFYGTQRPEDFLYLSELKDWEKSIQLRLTVDTTNIQWQGSVGFVTELIAKETLPSHAKAFICGPEIMMKSSAKELVYQGLVTENIFVSMERNMKCGVGICGHCLWGKSFVCKDGTVFPLSQIQDRWSIMEL